MKISGTATWSIDITGLTLEEARVIRDALNRAIGDGSDESRWIQVAHRMYHDIESATDVDEKIVGL